MKKRSYTLLIIIIFFSVFLAAVVQPGFSFGGREKKPDEKKLFSDAERKWKNQGIKEYITEVIYTAGNRPPEEILLTVKDGAVINLESSMSEAGGFSDDFVNSLTVENMFDRMRKSLETAGPSSLKLSAEYDEKLGYIKKLSRYIPRDASVPPRGPFGTDYHIEVKDLKVIE